MAALPNTQKQTQGGCQNEETKNMAGPNERTDQKCKKITKTGHKQSDAEFNTLVIKMFKELRTSSA